MTSYSHAMPNQGWAPLTVYFSPYGSAGPSGEALRYDWDLDGDGSFETDATETGGYAQRTYVRPNTYEVSLRVTPADGSGNIATTTVEVRHPGSSTVDYWTHFDDSTVGRIDLQLTAAEWARLWAAAPDDSRSRPRR